MFAALPVMYLVNGLVLFETLPLYLTLFLFLAFAAHYTRGFAASASSAPAAFGAWRFISSALLAAFALYSMYHGAYRPLQKNLLLIEAMRIDGKTDVRVFGEYESALAYRSPIGQEEALFSFFTFTKDYIRYIRTTEAEIPKDKVEVAVQAITNWRKKESDNFIGIKSEYAYAAALAEAARATKDPEYSRMARESIAKARAASPAQLAMLELQKYLAAIDKDQQYFNEALEQERALRPDVNWPAEMQLDD
jgi:hypothetical protein